MSMVSYFFHRGQILVHPWVAYFQTNPLLYPSTKLRRCRWHGPPQCSTGCGTLSRHAVERGQAHGRSDLGWTKCPNRETWEASKLDFLTPKTRWVQPLAIKPGVLKNHPKQSHCYHLLTVISSFHAHTDFSQRTWTTDVDSIGLFHVDHLNISRFQEQAKGRKSQETNSVRSWKWICKAQLAMSSLEPSPVTWSDPTFGGSGTGTGTVSGTATLAISPSPWAKMTRDRSSVSTTGTSTWWKYGYSRIFNSFNSWLCRIFHGNMNFHGSSSRFRKNCHTLSLPTCFTTVGPGTCTCTYCGGLGTW